MAKTPVKKTEKNSAPEIQDETGTQLKELFVNSLQDILWAEKHLTKALPKMAKAATSPELVEAFETHLEQTQEHIVRLEKVFEILEERPVAKKCDAMKGLVEEAEGIIEETEEGTATRDVGLILAAQKVEHYEIATYGGLAQLARTLEFDDVSDILEETLTEEKETDQLLTGIAENNVNYEAKEEPSDENE